MSLIWTPSAPFDELDRVFDSVFDGNALNPRARHHNRAGGAFHPRMDVHEDTEKNLVTATLDLPGMKKEDVNIDIHNGRLTISGEVNSATEEKKDGYVVRERRSGKFSRALPLPNGVKAENVNAALNDGVLTVTWPKTTPEQEAKRITVN